MKVKKILLVDCLNFAQNLEIDLTYPADHPTKAGLPLEKVCFIGQSGTGKTALLNMVKFFTFNCEEINQNDFDSELYKKNVEFTIVSDHREFTKEYDKNDLFILKENGIIQSDDFKNLIVNNHGEKPWLIHYPHNIQEKPSAKNKFDFNKEEGAMTLTAKKIKAKNKSIWDFSQVDVEYFTSVLNKFRD